MRLLRKIRQRITQHKLQPLTRQVATDRLTYLPAGKLLRIEEALARTGAVDGDVLEFGVALGGSAIILANHLPTSKRFIGFDVFGMIPPPTSDKDDEFSRNRYEVIKSGGSKGIGDDQYYGYRDNLFEQVQSSFGKYGMAVDGDRISLHKGLFEDTWRPEFVEAISLVHIDCDWYDPVVFCLDACADKMSPQGIIVIDDYNDYGGCRTAVNEFLASRSDFAFEEGPNPFLRKTGDSPRQA